MTRDRGFVLVNALILVAALSGVAVYLLARAEDGRARLAAGQQATRLVLGLDAFEALALTLLDRDTGAVDHMGEAWARTGATLSLEQGRVTGRIRDEQGLFNLNWLADPQDSQARAAFERLAEGQGLPALAVAAIVDFLRPGGPEARAAFAALTPPLDPVGGALASFEQLRGLPGLGAGDLDRMRLYSTAIPASAALNVNTASPAVLAAVLPGVSAERLARAVAARAETPFAGVEEFVLALGLPEDGEEGAADGFPPGRLSVASSWFRISAAVELEGRTAARIALVERRGVPLGSRVAWRLAAPP